MMDLYQLISTSVSPLLARSRRLTRELNLYNGELAWLRKSYFVPLSQYYSLGALNKLEMQKSVAIMAQLMDEAGKQGVAARQELDALLDQVAKIRTMIYMALGLETDPTLRRADQQITPAQGDDIKRLLSVLLASVEEQQSAGETLRERLSDCHQILSRLQSDKGQEIPNKGSINEIGNSTASSNAQMPTLAFCR